MRDILFRGKVKNSEIWVEGSLLVFPRTRRMKILVWNRADLEFDGFEVEPETVGQYTEVSDVNGKRIFEGDVMEFDFCGFHYIGVVNMTEGNSRIVCEEGAFFLDDTVMMKLAVKVGNVHDNPELLN